MSPRARTRLGKALSELDDALAEYREALRKAQLVARKARRQLDEGMTAAEVLRASGLAEHRKVVDDAAKNLEQARHDMRVLAIEVAQSEGTSLGELGRLWGLSRQRIQTLAKETKGNDVG